MAEVQDKRARRCAQCGSFIAKRELVCPECHNILTAPSGRAKTPLWLIITLILFIVALASYCGYLAYQVFVQHNF